MNQFAIQPSESEAGLGREGRPYDTAQILQWHVLLRIVVSFFILFSTIAFHFSDNLSTFYGLVGVNVLVTLLSAFFINRLQTNVLFIWFQVIWDILFVTALIYVSGGIRSLFNFMYILSVINSSILLTGRGTLVAALVYFGFYVLIVTGQYLEIIHPLGLETTEGATRPDPRDLIFKIVLNGSAMLIAAWLSTKVSEQAKLINRKLYQKQTDIEELKALNEHIVQSINMGLLSLNPKRRIMFVNQSVGTILEVDPNRYIGVTIDKLFPRIDLGGERSRYPQQITFGEGERQKFLNVSYSVLTDHRDENIGWIISIQDQTAIRRMEEEIKRADKQAAVGKLAAGMAHEIRNPLASMSGSIQLLRNELDLDPVNQHLMDIVVRETDRLNMLITDFLTFAKPLNIEKELVDLRALLSETLGILRNDPVVRNGVVVEEEFNPALFVNADSDQLRQLFWNLLSNALQAMPGGGRLTIAAEAGDFDVGGGKGVLVQIADTGMGMDEQDRRNIFDPFFTTKEMGSGLGLTTAYRIVENHEGRIWCETKPGAGTTFFVLFPSA